jgi:transcriptional regulator with XRE-family HTH domain
MNYHEKLGLFLETKNMTQKEIAEKLEVSPTMLGRYCKGNAEFSSAFIKRLSFVFPDINLQDIFSESEENLLKVEEAQSTYEKEKQDNMIAVIDSIQKQLNNLKKDLAQNCHKK